MHLGQGALLIALVREADEAVAAGHAAHGIRHDLGRLAGRESTLEQRHQHVLVDLGAEITDEDGKLGTTIVAGRENRSAWGGATGMENSTHRRSARPPPEAQLSLKGRCELGIMEPFRVRALAAAAGLVKSMKQYPALLDRVSWLTVTFWGAPWVGCVPRKLVTNHLDADLLSHAEPDALHEVLVHPWLELAHPTRPSADGHSRMETASPGTNPRGGGREGL